MDPLGRQHVRPDAFVERHQLCRAGADMIGHGRDRQFDPFARIQLALPVERLMIGVFLDQDHRQQARSRKAARDRMEGRRRLRDHLAGPAAELLTHVLGHELSPRDDIEGFGDILPDLREPRAAAARTRGRHRVNDDAGAAGHQESPAASPCAAQSCEPRRSPLQPGGVLAEPRREFLKLQLHLVEEPLAALGARAEHRTLHLGDHQLNVLDIASAPDSFARVSINAAFSASLSSGRGVEAAITRSTAAQSR